MQNPVKMGYLSVMALVNHIEKKPVEKKVDTGVVMVTKENMETPEIKELLSPPIENVLAGMIVGKVISRNQCSDLFTALIKPPTANGAPIMLTSPYEG